MADQEEAIREAVAAVDRVEAELRAALAARNQVMERARDSGLTWRSIATAAGMTEHGVRKALEFRREIAGRGR